MENNLDSAEAIIQLQAKINARLMDLYRLLSNHVGIKSATRMCEVRRYQNKTIFEVCVDVETNHDLLVSFWFEFGCENKHWYVIASVNRTVRDGQDILHEYPESSVANLDQLERIATQASDWLINKAKDFDFDKVK